MAKEKEKEKERGEKGLFVGALQRNCVAELKILLTALLFLCIIATLLQFLPRFTFSPSDLRHCLSTISSSSSSPSSSQTLVSTISSSSSSSSSSNSSSEKLLSSSYPSPALPPQPPSDPRPPSPPPSLPPPPPAQRQDEILDGGIIKRAFNPYGAAAYNFILMSAYRGGLTTFAVVGLASKPLHLFGNPTYHCQWVPQSPQTPPLVTPGYKILPDWGYGRVYTVVVVNCTFPHAVGRDGAGGKLLLHASTAGGGDLDLNVTDTIEALIEAPGRLNESLYAAGAEPKYDYLYCGSSLYGNLSPQRVREWIAYHVKLFGEKSHFVIHDAGGVHSGVLEVLKPWMEKGYVTLQDIREQERFDGYYHNQFLVVNDCLHRYRFMAKWMFFFDVDEYIYVPHKYTINSVLNSLSAYSQFTIEQIPMSNKLCLSSDAAKVTRKWGMEKLVYKDVKRGIRRDRKYAVQPRNVFATGVHMSQNLKGRTTHKTEHMIKYFHYHGTIAERREPCRKMVNTTDVAFDGRPYVLDTTLRDAAPSVKIFELKQIGSRLQTTHQ